MWRCSVNYPVGAFDALGLYTINQLVGRLGEILLSELLTSSPNYVVIMHASARSVAAHGPDVIAYNKLTDTLEFFDNKAWSRSSVSSVPRWMDYFDIKEYRGTLETAVKSGRLPPRAVQAVQATLKGSKSVTLKITPLAGKLSSIGSRLISRGIEFMSEHEVRAAARAGKLATASKAVCRASLVVAAAIEVLANPAVADAAQPLTPWEVADRAFEKELYGLLEKIRTGSRESADWRVPGFYQEAQQLFIDAGYLRDINSGIGGRFRMKLGLLVEPSYEWSTDLTEHDLDSINGVIGMESIFNKNYRELEIKVGSKILSR